MLNTANVRYTAQSLEDGAGAGSRSNVQIGLGAVISGVSKTTDF